MAYSIFDDLWGMEPLGWEGFWPGRTWRRTRPYPPVNLYGNEEKLVLTSEIPGLKSENLDIKVEGRSLTIRGTRHAPELSEDECFTCRERGHGDFERTLTLPYEIESDKVEANYDKGVLMVHLPRAESSKPRKIEIKAA